MTRSCRVGPDQPKRGAAGLGGQSQATTKRRPAPMRSPAPRPAVTSSGLWAPTYTRPSITRAVSVQGIQAYCHSEAEGEQPGDAADQDDVPGREAHAGARHVLATEDGARLARAGTLPHGQVRRPSRDARSARRRASRSSRRRPRPRCRDRPSTERRAHRRRSRRRGCRAASAARGSRRANRASG